MDMKSKAQATMISTMMIVLVSVSLAGMAMVWAQSYIGQTQLDFSESLRLGANRVIEDVSIDQVSFSLTSSPQLVTIYVRNAGRITLVVSGVFVRDQLWDIVSTSKSPTGTKLQLSPGESGFVVAELGASTLVVGETYRIGVSTERGNSVFIHARAE